MKDFSREIEVFTLALTAKNFTAGRLPHIVFGYGLHGRH